MTNRLLLEAGYGTTYYEWGGKELDRRTRRANLVQVVNLTQAITPTVTSAMRYRSQYWLNNRTSGIELVRHRRVRDRFAQHEVRLPGELLG